MARFVFQLLSTLIILKRVESNCNITCIHGSCLKFLNICICDLGWTGVDCNTDCGCNGHSSCFKSLGYCDGCINNTTGLNCHLCKSGYYWHSDKSKGCQPCDCNGHGNFKQNFCDPNSGRCFCIDNTEGVNCEKCSYGFYGDPRNNKHCYFGCSSRALLTSIKSVHFGSMVHSLSPSSFLSYQCLWILTIFPSLETIESPSSNQSFITPDPIFLTIDKNINVDCPNNHIEVYDGLLDFVAPSQPGKKLGSFCGHNIKSNINLIANSGYLSIYFERNNFSQGFNASIVRLACPKPCLNYSNRQCVNNTCICKDGYAGPTCTLVACPNQCYESKNQGVCDILNGRCQCMLGYAQPDCSHYIGTSPNRLVWTTYFNSESAANFLPLLTSNLPRMGHSLISINESLWLFGGLSTQKSQLNDVYLFNLPLSKWEEIEIHSTENKPLARHFHAAAVIQDLIFIHGGLSLSNGVLSDFWCFQTISRTWLKPLLNSDLPPPLAGHTLTKVAKNQLYMIGGYSPSYGFSDQIFVFDSKSLVFKTIVINGLALFGIYGHTSIYHSLTDTIYVYGGVIFNTKGLSVSSDLFALKVSTSTWFRLPLDTELNPFFSYPISRYFHSAVSTENYMLIIGGRDGGKNGQILSNMFAYVYKCNLWVNLDNSNLIEINGIPPIPALGAAMTSTSVGNIFLFGGMNGATLGRLVRLFLPKDICNLFSNSRTACAQHIGCTYCIIYLKNANKTLCFSNGESPMSCSHSHGASEVTSSLACDSKLKERICKHYKTCTDCLAYSSVESNKPFCKWCPQCSKNFCILPSSFCDNQTCERSFLSRCPDQNCNAFDCEKCLGTNGHCIWSSQLKNSTELDLKMNFKQDLVWRCIKKTKDEPNLMCPLKCHQHLTCNSCLKSYRLEKGWQDCSWSVLKKECISSHYIKLRCEGGLCGLLRTIGYSNDLYKWKSNHFNHPTSSFISSLSLISKDKCSSDCSKFMQSSECLLLPHCGWCAFNGSLVNGRGICMQGGLNGPSVDTCNINLFRKILPQDISYWLSQSEGPPKWYYLTKPKENECSNSHHTCDKRFENCVDLENGFRCECKSGYKFDGNRCKPICLEGCQHGICIEPNICQCHFGFVGNNCSIECKCNGHSNCAGVDKLLDCLECFNNTKGPQCQFCKPFFVGNPVNGGKCISCKEYCNQHTDICFSKKVMKKTFKLNWNHVNFISDLNEIIQEGSTVNDTLCYQCKHNTIGDRCNECVSGYFKSGSKISEGCIKCNCNGHADYCDPLSGENCQCENNTESDKQCSLLDEKVDLPPCWKTQCVKCKETYTGQPSNHHQCYKYMYLDREYCFNPESLRNCSSSSNILLKGQTVYYAVIPRYMNVDIRIIVDVSFGAIDFYFAFKDDIFIVNSNSSSQTHRILIDSKYNVFKSDDLNNHNLFLNKTFKSKNLKLRSIFPKSLINYIRVSSSDELFKIDALKNRLVITIPQQIHDLRSTRFYIILKGLSNMTFGYLSFRQDQSRIDLFVFFSVFFSFFFLFLAFCILIWKFKRSFDIQRARQLHAAEMKHMASRPFSSILVYLDPFLNVNSFYYALSSPVHHLHNKNCKTSFKWRSSSSYIKSYSKHLTASYHSDNYLIRPVSIEPTWDGVAAVVTTLLILPGDRITPVRMALATSLVSIEGSYQLLNC